MFFKKGVYDIYLKLCCWGLCYFVELIFCLFVKYGFVIVFDEKCFIFEVIVILMYWCWESVNEVLYIEYLLILLIIIFNLIVFFIMVIIKIFRKLFCMLLVVNLVLSDFFLGVYIFVIMLLCYVMIY